MKAKLTIYPKGMKGALLDILNKIQANETTNWIEITEVPHWNDIIVHEERELLVEQVTPTGDGILHIHARPF